jgi:hypothetical protein
MFILTPSTVVNARALRRCTATGVMRRAGTLVFPRKLMLSPTFWRLMLDSSLVRHALILAPIPIAMLLMPEFAEIGLAVAPVLLLAALIVEGNVLPVTARPGEDDHVDRGLDMLSQRGRAILTRIAAGRGMMKGRLVLVVEQSDLARLRPLTFVSVQDAETRAVLDLTSEERAMLREGLFDRGFDEGALLRINLVQKKPLRSVALEASSISAHARLAGMARRTLSARG